MKEIWDGVTKTWIKQGEPAAERPPTSTPVEAKFRLIIPRNVMDKISWWMHKTNQEVSGFGSLDWNAEKNAFVVKDAILLKQKVTGASAEIDPNAMAKAMFRMKDDPNGLKWHWHSHVNMGVFWSGDDREIIRSLGQRGWILATVFNYRDERKTAYFTQVSLPRPDGAPEPHDIMFDDIETSVVNYVSPELYEAWDREYAEHVTEHTYEAKTTHLPHHRDLKEEGTDPTRPSENVSYIYDYDTYGYGRAPGWKNGRIYNPVFDDELKTDEKRFKMIEDLDQDEIDFLDKYSPAFHILLTKYFSDCARKLDTKEGVPLLPEAAKNKPTILPFSEFQEM